VTQPADPPLLRELRARAKHNGTSIRRACEAKGILCVCKRDGGWGRKKTWASSSDGEPKLASPCGSSGPSRLGSHGLGAAGGGVKAVCGSGALSGMGNRYQTRAGGEERNWGSSPRSQEGKGENAPRGRKEDRRVVTL